jgi:hypothetical protein
MELIGAPPVVAGSEDNQGRLRVTITAHVKNNSAAPITVTVTDLGENTESPPLKRETIGKGGRSKDFDLQEDDKGVGKVQFVVWLDPDGDPVLDAAVPVTKATPEIAYI